MTDTALADVTAVVAAMAPTPAEAEGLSRETRLIADLAYDSVRLIELTIALEQHFGLPALEESQLASVTTVGEVADLVAAQLEGSR